MGLHYKHSMTHENLVRDDFEQFLGMLLIKDHCFRAKYAGNSRATHIGMLRFEIETDEGHCFDVEVNVTVKKVGES